MTVSWLSFYTRDFNGDTVQGDYGTLNTRPTTWLS